MGGLKARPLLRIRYGSPRAPDRDDRCGQGFETQNFRLGTVRLPPRRQNFREMTHAQLFLHAEDEDDQEAASAVALLTRNFALRCRMQFLTTALFLLALVAAPLTHAAQSP